MTLSSIYGELSPINYFRKKALLVDDLQGPKYVSTYLEPSRTSTMKIFCENDYGFKPFRKKLHRRSSTGFKIRLWTISIEQINKNKTKQKKKKKNPKKNAFK